MTTEINKKGLLDWQSKRFGREIEDTNADYIYFEDDDPRIKLLRNDSGEVCILIGYCPKIELSQPYARQDHVGGQSIVIDITDGAIFYVNPESLREIL